MSKYPEHDKLTKVKDQSQTIGEFLDWLSTQGIHLASYSYDGSEHLWDIFQTREELLAQRFDINLLKLENEKRQMLKEIRETNDQK